MSSGEVVVQSKTGMKRQFKFDSSDDDNEDEENVINNMWKKYFTVATKNHNEQGLLNSAKKQ